MKEKKQLQSHKQIETLAATLAQSKNVRNFDRPDEPESWTLAYTFAELEGSFHKFIGHYLPKLVNEEFNDQEISELLLDIGEEFRHILYHLKDPSFYGYLFDNDSQPGSPSANGGKQETIFGLLANCSKWPATSGSFRITQRLELWSC